MKCVANKQAANAVFTVQRTELFWGKKLYTECCSRKERSGVARVLAGIWQLKGVRRNADKARCPLCLEEEDAKHILLECKETKHWREKFYTR
jgi:hypothetical protein